MDAVAVDTDSRAMPPGFAARRVVEAAHAVRGAGVVYKKIDSTLRGPISAELSAALGRRGGRRRSWRRPSPGRPNHEGRRPTRPRRPRPRDRGAQGPACPVHEGHLPTLLEELSPVHSLSVEDLANPGEVRRALAGARCVVADAEEEGHLEALVRAVPDPSAVLWTGSAGLALAFGRVHPGPRSGGPSPTLEPARAVLVVVGSLSGVSRGSSGGSPGSTRRCPSGRGGRGGGGRRARGAVAGAARRGVLAGGSGRRCRGGRGDARRGRGAALRRGDLRRAGPDRGGHGGRGGPGARGVRDTARRGGRGGDSGGDPDRAASLPRGYEGGRVRGRWYARGHRRGAHARREGLNCRRRHPS
ncbi:hypothetical protein GBA65_08630 [Rubrobacter marinus]|uniref:Four-carbon acid sugar kinase N-terminal domain-containing protein n=1 Tax=Rubrobacter marinus TaxID=2653852 RepID=A0A6G8PWI9_9ACTN|nr:hypothetical protein GBA65_08630 [Rubrobacter marinus]